MIRGKWIEAGFYVGEVLSQKNGHVRVNLHAIGNVHIDRLVPSTSLTIPLPCGLGKPTHGKAVPDIPSDPR
jgi:hypothetical protein